MEKNKIKWGTCGYCGVVTLHLTYNSWLCEEVCEECDNNQNWDEE